MKLFFIAVGSLKKGAERTLVDDYCARARKLGRGLGIRDITEVEVASGGGKAAEADRLLSKCPPGAQLIVLDEGGVSPTSADFAHTLAEWRDAGIADICCLIGGADGHGDAVKAAASMTLAFGPQTWPHKLARVMLTEQVYRAMTILAGTPYHKA